MEKINYLSLFFYLAASGYIAAFSLAYFVEGKEKLAGLLFYLSFAIHSLTILLIFLTVLYGRFLPKIDLSYSLLISGWFAAAFPGFYLRSNKIVKEATALGLAVACLLLFVAWKNIALIERAVATDGGKLYYQLHALSLLIAIALLATAVCFSLSYFLRQCLIRGKDLTKLNKPAPSLEKLDAIFSRSLRFGILFLFIGLSSGFILAHQRWQGAWSLNPTVIFSLASLIWFMIVLILRLFLGFRGKKAVLLVTSGFLLLLFTFIGIVFFFPKGKHRALEKQSFNNPATIKLETPKK